MTTNNEIAAFEDFKFRLGDIVIRVTDTDRDKGIVVARSLNEFTSGVNRSYRVAFDSVLHNQDYEEIELLLLVRS